ncbi:CDP-diacylglycerol--glycerol-3-phosphate 3-phosphatidyltransferase [Clostridium sp. 19966]|uniref:CDP-diacylglycerol--glycerol-3-phosphate 3-phosphatidyltransferase n=1 Tax=Clostridium sp. 19966 TaxID=2768166 RepID=UPI0028DF4956|nr:CDP-diacylglycerol--glycerol-3-phosphate 3-phosphatidyltransferase [Clostridium sp. 19966]MDT8716406.1 CDP-diacylglycerol--glycerol-3-phosphate 3-phosphatidyltransferase [Clostridium sp. 19966]
MNLANKLTVVRIFLIPVFLIFIAVRGIPYGTILATLVFILAALTDKLDGYIARSRNQITKFGKLMDPLADKLLVTAAFISLMEYRVIPGWAAIIIIARELAVTGLRSIAASEGIVLAAGLWGKLKTVAQIVAIILCLLQVNVTQQKELTNFILQYPGLKEFLTVVSPIALWIAVIITLFSGFDYFIKNRHVIKTEK